MFTHFSTGFSFKPIKKQKFKKLTQKSGETQKISLHFLSLETPIDKQNDNQKDIPGRPVC